MNKRLRNSLLVGATVATIGLGGLASAGIASADSTTASGTTLIEKLATKFNLNKDEVAAVFSADRTEHEATMKADQAARLAQAVKDGKLTQAQADYITNAQKEIDALRGTGDPGQEAEATRTAIHEKMDALRTWADTNKVDMQYVMGGHVGHGGPGGPGGGMPPTETRSSSAN